ncbi:MAG: amino acid adenylation domain-containing protein [Gammaproteobacteria bacterium]|nr:MAG: amino acid adenylation domain-containing protein [Gammaproteobacteria bacterium]
MNLDEGLTTKLWLEKPGQQTTDAPSDHLHYQIKKYTINKNNQKNISNFFKKNHLSWEIFIHSVWGLLLNRFSSTDFILYGSSTLHNSRTNLLKIDPTITSIKSIINDKMSAKAFYQKIKTQLNKKNHFTDTIPEDLRYLLVIQAEMKKNKKTTLRLLESHRFPLVLSIHKKDFSQFTLFYHSALFSQQHIDQIAQHLLLLMEEMSDNINQKICKINLLTAEEKELILSQWKSPHYPFTIPILNACTHELFVQQAQQHPDYLAVYHNDTHVSYKELDDASTQLAHLLIKKGIKPGDLICVLMDRTPTLIVAMLAIFKTAAVYVPINPNYPDERIKFILEDTKSHYVLVNDIHKLPKGSATKTLEITPTWGALKLEPLSQKTALPLANPHQIAYIIYTSGTTGQPKGVMIKHQSLVNLIAWYQGCLQVTEKDRASQFASQGFDTYLCETIPFLASGASVHIVDDHTKLTPSLFFAWLEKQQITICDLPTAYALTLFAMTWPKTSIKTVKVGGEAITHYPNKSFSFDIWNCYGPTETTIEATYVKIYAADSPPITTQATPPIGKPIANTSFYVVDKYLQPVPIEIGGELLIGGMGVSAGYLNREELTNQKFIPGFHPGERLYKTGDLVRWLHDGNLEFIGRIDHQVKIRGYRIELGDIESAISKHPDVNEVVVLAKENLNGEKSLVAYIVPNLEKGRYLYQERCLLSMSNNQFIEATTEDISKSGVALSGITEPIDIGHLVQLHLKLPGLVEGKLFSGHVIWQKDTRCGIAFDLNAEEETMISKSIEYYLASHNVMELVLSSSAKRSLRKAMRKKLPDYMIPSMFVTLLQFPLTFSGKVDVKALPPPQEFEEQLQKEYIEPKTATEKALTQIWSTLLGKKNISMSDNFFDIGGNSLKAAELSVNILNQFKTSIPTKILFDLSYIPILAQFIDSKGKKYNTETINQREIQRDCILQDNIVPTKRLSKTIKNPQNILLTGAGGFLGIYLLRELLTTTQAKIYCLIRKGEFETAAKRLVSTVARFNLSNEISLADRRIVVIASDISFNHFGLPLEQYNSLVDKIDLIYHCGAQVNIMAAYNKLRGSNVQGTLEVIKFAMMRVDKPIHYISTLSSAYLKDEAGCLVEEFPDENYDELFGGYAISKWVSERLLTEAKNRGLPTAIYRSGYISGQSDTGITSLNDALLMLIKGCIQLGFAPDMNEKITILPVDFVSKATVDISLAYPDKPMVYHIDHPTGILWMDLIAWLNDYGYKIQIIPMKEWKEKLINIPQDNALFPFLPYYLAMGDKQTSPDVSVKNAQAALQQVGLIYPEINDKLLSTYFDYLCRVNFIPQPASSKTDETPYHQ